jgi:hypothetical protein
MAASQSQGLDNLKQAIAAHLSFKQRNLAA